MYPFIVKVNLTFEAHAGRAYGYLGLAYGTGLARTIGAYHG